MASEPDPDTGPGEAVETGQDPERDGSPRRSGRPIVRPALVAALALSLVAVAVAALTRGHDVPVYPAMEHDAAVAVVGEPRSVAPETMLRLRATDVASSAAGEPWMLPGGGEPLVWERALGPGEWEPAWYVYFAAPDQATEPHLEPYEERFRTLAGWLTDRVDVLTPPEPGTYRLCVADGACVRLTIAD